MLVYDENLYYIMYFLTAVYTLFVLRPSEYMFANFWQKFSCLFLGKSIAQYIFFVPGLTDKYSEDLQTFFFIQNNQEEVNTQQQSFESQNGNNSAKDSIFMRFIKKFSHHNIYSSSSCPFVFELYVLSLIFIAELCRNFPEKQRGELY